MSEKVSRRGFFQGAAGAATVQIAKWSPWLGLLGFQFHRYTYMGGVPGWAGYVTWFGKLLWFVPK